jgi:hypothetical protein
MPSRKHIMIIECSIFVLPLSNCWMFEFLVLKATLFVFISSTYSPSTFTGVGYQWTVSTSTSCNQWLSLAKPTLKVPPPGRVRSLVPAPISVGGLLVVHFEINAVGVRIRSLMKLHALTLIIGIEASFASKISKLHYSHWILILNMDVDPMQSFRCITLPIILD